MCLGCELRAAASLIDLRAGTGFTFPIRGMWGPSVTLSGMVQNTTLLEGGHALASLKGGRPCPLGTLDHVVVGDGPGGELHGTIY